MVNYSWSFFFLTIAGLEDLCKFTKCFQIMEVCPSAPRKQDSLVIFLFPLLILPSSLVTGPVPYYKGKKQ